MLLTLTLATALHLVPAADTVPGRWHLTGDISGYPVDQVCTIAQTGSLLSGRCVAAEGDAGGIEILGEVKEGTITFQHGGEYEGEAITVIYTARLETPTDMRGTIVVQPFDAPGTFTATPAPPEPPK